MGAIPTCVLVTALAIVAVGFGYILPGGKGHEWVAYQQEVEACREHYSTSLEELTKCLDVQLKNKD